MKKMTLFFIFVAIPLFISSIAHASVPEWKVDPGHSGIYFRVTHIFSSVNGFFPDFESDIKFDPANLNESRFSFKVKVKSINTNLRERDRDLTSPQFFDAKKYPEMTFESKSIKHLGKSNYQVVGTLTIKGVTKTISLPFIYFGFKQHPFNPKLNVAGFEARMNIDRLEYNVGDGKFYKMGTVGKDVDVLITVEATSEK